MKTFWTLTLSILFSISIGFAGTPEGENGSVTDQTVMDNCPKTVFTGQRAKQDCETAFGEGKCTQDGEKWLAPTQKDQ